MGLTIDTVFDGDVFRPEVRLDLTPNMHYVITIVDTPPAANSNGAPLKAEPDSAVVTDTLSDADNDRRVRLIRKKVREGLTQQEEEDLAQLQATISAAVNASHPLPFARLAAFEAAAAKIIQGDPGN
ncbi:MAG: hypothetical protein ACLQVD_03580 [Capsulimonadaceae bacterium]